MSRRRTLHVLAIACMAGAVAGGMYCGRVPILSFAGTWLDVGTSPPRSDYVLVLNGDENTRPFAAAALVKAGLARKVIVTTCARYPDQEDGLSLPADEVTRQVLLRRGVPEAEILVLDRMVDSTFHEAQALADFLDREPGVRVTIVTNPFHTRRARWIFAHALGPRAGQLAFVSAPLEDLPLDRWWTTSVGRESVPAEYMRLLYYLFRYSKTPWLVALLLAAVAGVCLYRRRRVARKG